MANAQVNQSIVQLGINTTAANAKVFQSIVQIGIIPGPPPPPANPNQPSRGAGGPQMRPCRDPNPYDDCLLVEQIKLRLMKFPPICSIPEEYRNLLPWDETFGAIPEQAVAFRRTESVLTPSSAAGDVLILTERVPSGYDGLLTGIYQIYTGAGFVQGQGDILWRIQVDQHFVKDFGATPFQLGNPQNPLPMTEGMILWSGQTLRYYVNVPNLSGSIQVGNSRIVVGIFGFYWPR